MYQSSSVLPSACYNTDTATYHYPLGQTSFQYGRSKIYNTWRQYINLTEWGNREVNWNFLRDTYGDNNSTGRNYFDHSIPNPPNNITRQYYANSSNAAEGFNDTNDLGTRKAMQNTSRAVTLSSLSKEGFPFTVPVYDSTAQAIFPIEAAAAYRGRQDPVNSGFNQLITYFHYYIDTTGVNVALPDDINTVATGCNRFGCKWEVSVTTCSSQTVNLYGTYKNDFFVPWKSGVNNSITGCGVLTSHAYKIQADPGYRALCCRQNWEDLPGVENSLTILSSFYAGGGQVYDPPVNLQTFSLFQAYCDPSWLPGTAACDLELQSYCGLLSVSTIINGTETWINACLSQTHPCNLWYSWIMYSYTQNNLSVRNTDLINDFVNAYCANNPQDTYSCMCMNSQAFNNRGFWTSYDDGTGLKSYSLLAVQTDSPLNYFSDPLCSSVPCRTDPDYFNPSPGYDGGPTTLISPAMVIAKRQCPQNMCFLINKQQTLTLDNVSSLQEISLINTNLFCQFNGVPLTRTVQYTAAIRSFDIQPGIIGRFFYTPQTGNLNGEGSAVFQVSLSLLTDILDQTVYVTYSTTNYDSTRFSFDRPEGVFNLDPLNPVHNLRIVPLPGNRNVGAKFFPAYGTYIDNYTVTLSTYIANQSQVDKQFPVRIVMLPSSLPAPNITPEQVPVDVQKSNALPVVSRTTIAITVLAFVLLLYALIFLVEAAQIQNFRKRLRQVFLPAL